MAADVGSLIRIMGNYGADDDPTHRRLHPSLSRTSATDSGDDSTALVTRDFLGGGSSSTCRAESQELDLDLEVPSGYEKRLDLKSGKVYLHRCNSPDPPTPSSSESNKHPKTEQRTLPKLQDLNFPPSNSKRSSSLLEGAGLDLKLFPSPQFNCQSVCTLDKVKSALERAERHTATKMRWSKSPPPPAAPSSPSIKDVKKNEEERLPSVSSSAFFATACPICLLYVLISKSNPKCPRCHTAVPVPTNGSSPTPPAKKPRLDLNISTA